MHNKEHNEVPFTENSVNTQMIICKNIYVIYSRYISMLRVTSYRYLEYFDCSLASSQMILEIYTILLISFSF